MPIYDYLTTSGVIVPDTSTLKADVQGEWTDAFGSTLLLVDDTPQGRSIDIEVAARDGVVRLAAELANQINPNIGSGIFLESICALHAVVPGEESNTVLRDVECNGSPGTIILSGSRISDSAGDYYASVSELLIPFGGQVLGDFQAVEPGPLDPAAGTVTTIIDGVFGWTSVTNTNTTPTTVGALAEDDNDLRVSRNEQLSLLSKGPVEAINSNVMALPGVRSVSIRENTDPNPAGVVIDGVTLTPHATWVCVQGGVDADIALALLRSKQTGSPYTTGTGNGTPVVQNIVDPTSGQLYPVIFTRQDDVPVAIRVTVAANSVTDPTIAIPDALLSYSQGTVAGERGFINGADVSGFECAAAINIQYPELFIRNVEVATVASGPTFGVGPVPIALWEAATLASGDISVVVV